tara:strand:- start:85 stop:294 length:210 start_codon:yes stop_codon:yes gene_type:complete
VSIYHLEDHHFCRAKKEFYRRGFFSFPRSTAILRNSTAAPASTVVVAVSKEEEEGAFMVDCSLLFSLLV